MLQQLLEGEDVAADSPGSAKLRLRSQRRLEHNASAVSGASTMIAGPTGSDCDEDVEKTAAAEGIGFS